MKHTEFPSVPFIDELRYPRFHYNYVRCAFVFFIVSHFDFSGSFSLKQYYTELRFSCL